jgi:hypothetical protein
MCARSTVVLCVHPLRHVMGIRLQIRTAIEVHLYLQYFDCIFLGSCTAIAGSRMQPKHRLAISALITRAIEGGALKRRYCTVTLPQAGARNTLKTKSNLNRPHDQSAAWTHAGPG